MRKAIATIIHTINCVFGGTKLTQQIPKQAVEAAVKFVTFSASQIDVLYTEFSARTALAPNLAKVLSFLEHREFITARDVTRGFSGKNRPNTAQARDWLRELVDMKLITTNDGKEH